MRKSEVTEEFSVCVNVPFILDFSITEIFKLGCTLESPGEHQQY